MSTAIVSETITTKIFYIRGQKVMLDKDLVELYQVKPIGPSPTSNQK